MVLFNCTFLPNIFGFAIYFMNRKQPQRTAQTKNNIIAAFLHLAREKKLSRITIRDICESAGCNRSTFYKYFAGVDDLLDQLEQSLIRDWRQFLQELPPPDDLAVLFRSLTGFYAAQGEAIAVLNGDNGDPSFIKKQKDELRPFILPLLAPNGGSAEQQILSDLYLSILLSLLSGWYSFRGQIKPQEVWALAPGIAPAIPPAPMSGNESSPFPQAKESASDPADGNLLIRKAETYITEHYGDDITLDDIAAQVDLNPAYLSVLFKKSTGQGFREYLNRLRIAVARRLLIETDDQIVDVASACGFNDQSYFTRVFKKSTGLTPKQYRDRQAITETQNM